MNDFDTAVIEEQNMIAEKVSVDVGFVDKPAYDFFKRVFDIVLSLIASILLIIPLTIISLCIITKDSGNPFYLHKRVGKNNVEIFVCKMKSMKRGSDNLEKMLTPEQLAEYKKSIN